MIENQEILARISILEEDLYIVDIMVSAQELAPDVLLDFIQYRGKLIQEIEKLYYLLPKSDKIIFPSFELKDDNNLDNHK